MTNAAPPASPPSKQSFWTTLPGILTGLAAVITALVAAAGLFLSHNGGPAQASKPNASSGNPGNTGNSANVGAGSSGQPATDSTSRHPAAGTGKVTTAEVVLHPGDWIDVDTAVSGSSSTGGDLIWASNQVSLYGVRNAVVARRTGKAGCTAALQQRSDSYLTVDQLRQRPVVCLSTDQGTVAELRFSAPDLHNDVPVAMTVWH